MSRLKRCVAAMLVLLWVPAASFCPLELSGLIEKGDCCSKKSSHPVSGPGGCEEPCGVLASATYLAQQDHLIVAAPVGEALLFYESSLIESHVPHPIERSVPATAPPELPGCWQFSLRTALPPRAPSFVS